MASQGRGARRKGHRWERQLAKLLSAATGLDFQKSIQQSRGGGAEESDVFCDSLPWLHIEAKAHKKVSIKAAMKQAVSDTIETGKLPVAITKDDYKEPLVTMRLDDFIIFLQTKIKQDAL